MKVIFQGVYLEILLRSEEHTSELQSHSDLVCRLLLEKKKKKNKKKKNKKQKKKKKEQHRQRTKKTSRAIKERKQAQQSKSTITRTTD